MATEFLVVAATLLELKAARLLPAPDADPDEVEAVLEERDLLFARSSSTGPTSRSPACSGPGWPSRRPTSPAGRRRGPPPPHRPRAAGRGRSGGAGRLAAAALTPAPAPRSPPPTSRRPGCRSPRRSPPWPAASRTGVQQVRGAGRPPEPPPSRSCRPARRPGAVQAIVGRARPGVDLRRHRRPLDRRRPGRPHRPDGRGPHDRPTPTATPSPTRGPLSLRRWRATRPRGRRMRCSTRWSWTTAAGPGATWRRSCWSPTSRCRPPSWPRSSGRGCRRWRSCWSTWPASTPATAAGSSSGRSPAAGASTPARARTAVEAFLRAGQQSRLPNPPWRRSP